MLHLGIDPGLSGALAILTDSGAVLMCRDMPTLKLTRSRKQINAAEIVDMLKTWSQRDPEGLRLTIEFPGVRPMQHAASGIKVGISWGRIVGMAEALAIPYDVVSPQRWHKVVLGDVPKGCAKDVSRAAAQRLWPTAELGNRKTQDRSDALNIAEYGRRMWGGGSNVRSHERV